MWLGWNLEKQYVYKLFFLPLMFSFVYSAECLNFSKTEQLSNNTISDFFFVNMSKSLAFLYCLDVVFIYCFIGDILIC